MTSKGGARAKGTDGSDFGHREKVASHYQISSSNKRRLKTCIMIHVILFLITMLKVAPDILNYFDLSIKNIIPVSLPKPTILEMIWLTSIFFIFPALYSIRKNFTGPMEAYIIGISVCGLCPMLLSIVYHSGDFKIFLLGDGKENLEKFFGIPVVLIMSVQIAFTFLVHTLSLVYANNLTRAWAPKKGKKKA